MKGNSGNTIKERETHSKRKRSLLLTGLLFLVFAGLTCLQIYLQHQQGKPLKIPANILLLTVVNLNLIVLMIFIVMVGRNLVKIYFEHKRRALGAKFKVKLITAFIALTIIPTTLLFVIASGLITSSIENWFNRQREDALKNSLEIAQAYYQELNNRGEILAQEIVRTAEKSGFMDRENHGRLVWFLSKKAKEHKLKAIEIFDARGNLKASSKGRKRREKAYLANPHDARLTEAFINKKPLSWDKNRYHMLAVPLSYGEIVLSYKIPSSHYKSLNSIIQHYEGYQQLKELKNPIKTGYILVFLMATLLILFSSIWFGLHLARGITVPIEALAEATREVAGGNLDIRIDVEADDEIGILVNSFNQMTQDLQKSRRELEERKRYTETVLENIATGVISLDKEGKILSINRAARNLLKLDYRECLGMPYKQVFKEGYLESLRDTVRKMLHKGREKESREVKLVTEEGVIHLIVGISPLRDEKGKYSGMVVVMEDITELVKAQRAAAWEEVARRVAHEIKNPLTPISLSAQRLKKKFGGYMQGEDGEIFYRCTDTIVKEVEELKRMVNEFYKFARLPKITPKPTNIQEIIKDLAALYSASHKEVSFQVELPEDMPSLLLDRDQINRVFMNLLENAIEAMDGRGKITIKARYDEKSAVVEIADEGMGVKPEDKERVFMPYFSTKEKGKGLGLAIVSRIIADHGGYIRLRNNKPRGTVFIIELPGRAA